ncbi:MAG: asparagine synthase-related protein [Deltaproteobacteria bacterium]
MISGPRAANRLPECLERLRHRGPDEQCVWSDGDLALGFARLAINGDGDVGRQPHRHGEMVGAINGEIYNHQELRLTYGLASTECDTDIVLPLVERLGPRAIDVFDGFYSAVVLRPSAREAMCLRDHMGKKPLFVGRASSNVFITSELKALDECAWFDLLPRGVSKVDLDTGEIVRIAAHRPVVTDGDLASAFERAVHKRMPPPGQRVGVFLSGGLDSSLVAAFASRLRDDVTYFTLGDANSPDRQAVDTVIDALGLVDVRLVPRPEPSSLGGLIRAVVHATESFNPSIVSNGLATYLLAREAQDAGIKVVLTGEGADELFGGYHSFREQDPWLDVRRRLIDDMQITELRRLDMSCMAHGVEARCPFLDRSVRAMSDGLGFRDLFEGDKNKVALRRHFDGVLPPEVLHRRKASFDVGSGIRADVVRHLRRNRESEREELRKIWQTLFRYDHSEPYFHAYPIFDAAIERRGENHR